MINGEKRDSYQDIDQLFKRNFVFTAHHEHLNTLYNAILKV